MGIKILVELVEKRIYSTLH